MQYSSQILRGIQRALVTIILIVAVPFQAAAETSGELIRQALLQQDAAALRSALDRSELDINALAFSHSWRVEQMAAIHLAAESGDVNLGNILVNRGASTSIRTSLGNTALHVASKNGHRDFVDFLTSAEVELNLLNQAGKSALILAREQGHQDIVALLTLAGALDSEATAHGDDKILGSRQVIYEPLERSFKLFNMNAQGDRLVAVDTRDLLTVHNPKSGVFLEQLQLDAAPLGLVAQKGRLILTYPDKVEFRAWANLVEKDTYKLQARPTAISAIPGSPHFYYSDGEVVYRFDTKTGESTEVHRQWGINQLDVLAEDKALFVSTDFAITAIDPQSFETKGTYNGYNRARYLLDDQLIVLRGDVVSSQEQGVSYLVIDHRAAVVKEFSIPRTFQQQDVRITRFKNQQILTESFNQIALTDQSGQSFLLTFNEFKFEDFAFHPEVGFVLFNPSEIQLFSTSGVINTRLVPNTNFKPLRTENERRKLSFMVRDGAIDVHNNRGKKTTLSSTSEVTSLATSDKYLAAGHLDGSYTIWRLPSLKLLEQKPYLTGKVSSIYIDEDNGRVYLGGLGRIAATGFGKGSNDTVNIMLRGHDNFVTALALSAGGDLLISSGDDGTVKFWDVADHRLVQNLAFSGGWLDSIELASDLAVTGRGPGIASFSLDAADLYAEMTDPAPRVTVQKANTSQVNKVIVDPTGRFSANNDGASVNVRDIKSGMLQTRIFPKAGSTNDFAFTRDGNSLVLVSGEHMEFWDPASGLLQKQVNHGFTGGAFHSINAIPDINLFLAANTWGWHEPFYIHANSGERRGVWNYLQQVNMQGDGPVDIAISADGEHLAVFGHKRIHLFKSREQSYELVTSIPREKPDITNQYFRDYLGFSADGKYLRYLSFARNNEVVVWDVENQSEALRKPGKLSVFLNDHKLLYMSDNVSLSIHDIHTGETEVVSRFEHNDLISSLSYNANEATFTSADIWGNTITWDARSYQKIRSLDRFDNDVYTSELSSDGRFLAYNNKQGIHLLDLQNMNLLSLDGNNYPYFGAFTNNAAKFYYRNGSEYHYIDLSSPQLTNHFAFETTWDPETTKGTEISLDDRYLMFVSEETYHIYDLEQGIEVKRLAKQGMFADKAIFSFMSFDPAQQRITGQVVSSPKPGFAQTQLVHYQYDQGVAEHLSEPVTFDMSDEIKQFTASKDLKVNRLSPSGRYYAYSQDRYLKLIDLNTRQQIFNARKSELEYLVFDDQEQFLLLVDETGYLEKISLKDQSIVSRYKTTEAKVTSVKSAGEFILLLGDDEVIHVFDLLTDERVVSIAPRGADDFMIMSPEGYYYATKNAAQLGVAFRKGYQIYPFEQFDLQFNRPDLAFANLMNRGIADPELVAAYTQAFEKRQQQLGNIASNEQPPTLTLDRTQIPVNTESETLTLNFAANPDIESVHVWINNVPLYGRSGLPADKLKGKVEVELSAGRNRIQLAGRSKSGLESLRETVEVFSGKGSDPKTHLVAIGASEYQQSARNLNYAVKDVTDLRDTLTDENTVVHMLANEDVTRENVRQIKAALMETAVDDKVILFYAGHGMLTGDLDYFLGTYDVDFSSPEERGLDYRTLEYLFDGIPARNRLMLIDACHSGEADKFAMEAVAQMGTGGSLRANSGLARGLDFGDAGAADEAQAPIPAPKLGLQNSFNLSKQLFADIRKDTGVTVISASGSTEFAWEDGSLSNGVFTYSLLKGLREGEADQDGDGAVRISELQSYVRAQVVKLTNGLQQPTFRTENIENDWSIYRVSD